MERATLYCQLQCRLAFTATSNPVQSCRSQPQQSVEAKSWKLLNALDVSPCKFSWAVDN